MEIPLNQHSRNILLDIVLLYFSVHLNINFNIKSINVIREVFKT
jgi:DNA repair protein RecO (recombination protein O)